MIRHGRKELTHDVLTGFATLLNVPANDLFALAGIDRSHAIGAADPDAAEFAKLICDLRPLSAGQVRQVREWAHSSEPG